MVRQPEQLAQPGHLGHLGHLGQRQHLGRQQHLAQHTPHLVQHLAQHVAQGKQQPGQQQPFPESWGCGEMRSGGVEMGAGGCLGWDCGSPSIPLLLGAGNAANTHSGHWCLAGINWAKPCGGATLQGLTSSSNTTCFMLLSMAASSSSFPFPAQPACWDWEFYTGALGWGLQRCL